MRIKQHICHIFEYNWLRCAVTVCVYVYEVGRARVPPRWALGYHLCRRASNYLLGFEDSTTQMEGIPYDSDCIDDALATSAFELDTR